MHPALEELSTRAKLPRRFLGFAARAASAQSWYHRAQLRHSHLLPDGAALLVGNHGLYGYETPAFFHLLRRETGRYPVGLADRGFYKVPVLRRLLSWCGGVEGTPENADAALRLGKLVVCYPGGAREVFKNAARRYQLAWEHALGFVKVAQRTQVPVVPFAGFGIDEAFALVKGGGVRVQVGPSTRYRVPVGVGFGPLPFPVQFRFSLGEPISPPSRSAGAAELGAYRELVAERVRTLLVQCCHG